MSYMREALEASGIEPDRQKPSEAYECLKVRESRVYGAACGGFSRWHSNGPRGRRKFTSTHKWCPQCEQWLPLTDFTPAPSEPSGRYGWCRPCVNALRRKAFSPRRPGRKDAA